MYTLSASEQEGARPVLQLTNSSVDDGRTRAIVFPRFGRSQFSPQFTVVTGSLICARHNGRDTARGCFVLAPIQEIQPDVALIQQALSGLCVHR